MAEGPAKKKQRQSRTTTMQYRLYVDMLESDINFRENSVKPDHPNSLSDAWEKLVTSLNASGGPKKGLNEWKRVFTDWKNKVRARARAIANAQKETRNIGEPEKALTELEQKLIYLTGNVAIEGLPGVPEVGLNNDDEIAEARKEESLEDAEIGRTRANIKQGKRSELSKNKKILKEINGHLANLVALKEKELQFQKLKLQLKYDVTFEDDEQLSKVLLLLLTHFYILFNTFIRSISSLS